METNDPREQLSEIERVQTLTRLERYRTADWAMPVLTVGAALLVAAIATRRGPVVIGAVVVWDVFCLIWLRAIRRPSGVRMPIQRSRRDIAVWIAETIAANAVFFSLVFLIGLYNTLLGLGVLYVAYLAYISLRTRKRA